MPSTLTPDEEAEYRKGLELVQKYGPYLLQRRSRRTGEWVSINPTGVLKGIRAAQEALDDYLKKNKGTDHSDIRYVPKIVADAIRETIKVLRKQDEAVERKRRPRVYLPDNL